MPDWDLNGRTCVVTGANSGIGRSTVLDLARRGAHVVLVCRDPERGAAALAAVQAESPAKTAQLLLADLASQAEIRRLAAEILERCPRIDVLLNNAGIVNLTYSTTIDGIESTFAVNHLAYFQLTLLLLERIQQSAPARIVNVASEAHKFGKLDFDDLGNQRSYKSMRVYGQSKLANVLFTYELARRIDGRGVTVNCVHPGAVATRLGQNNGRIATILTKLLAPFFRTPEQGAATSIWAVTAPELSQVSGKYLLNCREGRSNARSHDPALALRLWEESARLTGLAPA